MLRSVKVAVTGGIACGKSTVCGFLKELGAHVESADEIIHQLLSSIKIRAGKITGPQDSLGNKIIALLGPDVIVNDQLDRYQIAKKVFKKSELLQGLEQILHPEVRLEVKKRYQQLNQSKSSSLFVVEIPLLYEAEMEQDFDYVVAVIANERTSKERFIKNSNYEAEEYERRAARQMSKEQKAKKANYVIVNNGSLQELREATTQFYNHLKTHQLGV